jgi:CRP/FNR family cyclic AMP-dependent transcriptional regulator
MTTKEIAGVLSRHAFLHGLRAGHIKTLAGLARPVAVAVGQCLVREGDQADAFYLLELGRVAIEVNAPGRGVLRIQTLEGGDIVGWSWLLPPHRWHFDARALEPVRALALDAKKLRALCEGDHELGFQLLRRLVAVMAGRLAATRLQLLDVYK